VPLTRAERAQPGARKYRPIQEVSLSIRDLGVAVPRTGARSRELKHLLEDVSIDVSPGELLSIVGPSGAGKSTFLKAISGQETFTGFVTYGDVEMRSTNLAQIRQLVGIVPQRDLVDSPLPLGRLLHYGALLRMPHAASATREQSIQEVLTGLQIANSVDTPAVNLSGGEKKRTAVALELLAGVSVMFLDEPTTGLDPDAEAALVRLLQDLAVGGRRTVVMITHSPTALADSDNIAVFGKNSQEVGQLAYHGHPSEAGAYFGVADWDFVRIYQELNDPSRRFAGRFRAPLRYQRPTDRSALLPSARTWLPLPSQARVLTLRMFEALSWAIPTLKSYLLQPWTLLVALLLFLRWGNLNGVTPSEVEHARAFVGFVAIASVMPGILNASRDIVREAELVRRDLAVGMNIAAFVASRFAFVGTLAVGQSLIMTCALLFQGEIRPGLWGPSSLWDSGVILALGALAATALGLAFSASGREEASVLQFLPIIVVLQILLSGAFLSLDDKPVMLGLGYLMPSYWVFRGVAAANDLRQLDPECYQVVSDRCEQWARSGDALGQCASWLGGLVVVYILAAALLVWRRYQMRGGALVR
jgi:ABC-type multidrug transport system ATPase subunit